MDFNELRLRISPWIALILGLAWIAVVLSRNALDIFPGIGLLGAAFVPFTAIRWLNRPYHFRSQDANVEPDLKSRPD